ncbi:MAG TPA: helix-turn-helix domain-containing protein [Mycobacterium sp.]
MLARVFGCCRVVFNDALRVRDEAYRAGVKLCDTLIQRQVITAAKRLWSVAGWPRCPVWRWCSRSTTPGGRGATSSTHTPGNARAASWAVHG